MLEGLRKPLELIVIVITLLAYGCPIQTSQLWDSSRLFILKASARSREL
jgi:hypothetical protein